MEYVLIAGGVGLVIGFSLGVLAMTFLAAPDRDKPPEPRPVRTHAVSGSWPGVREPSSAAVGVNRRGRSVLGIAELSQASSDTKKRESD